MKLNKIKLLLSTSSAMIATAPLVSGQVSFVAHSPVYICSCIVMCVCCFEEAPPPPPRRLRLAIVIDSSLT
jgi:hypothetical protein